MAHKNLCTNFQCRFYWFVTNFCEKPIKLVFFIFREIEPTHKYIIKIKENVHKEIEIQQHIRKSHFISNAKAVIEQNDLTNNKRKLHAKLKNMAERITELCNLFKL